MSGYEFSNNPIDVQIHPIIESDKRTPWAEGTSSFDENLDGVCWKGNSSKHEQGWKIPTKNFQGRHMANKWTTDSGRPDFSQPDFDANSIFGKTILGKKKQLV